MKPKSFIMPKLSDLLQAAANNYDLPNHPDFGDLAELSSNTIFEGIDTHGDSAVQIGDELFAPATVYVTLNYGEHDIDGPTSWSDGYPARVKFRVDGDLVEVLAIQVDTSSFFE